MRIWACLGQINPSKFDKICPLAIPNQISTTSMHIPSLVKIHWCILKLSSGNENMSMSRARTKFGENPLMFTQVIIPKRKTDGRTDLRQMNRHTDVQHETIISRHYIMAGYKTVMLMPSGVQMIRWYQLAVCWKLQIPIIDWTFSQSIIGKLIDAACFQLTTWGKTNSYLLMYSETILSIHGSVFTVYEDICHRLHNSLTIKICDNKPPLLIYKTTQ